MKKLYLCLLILQLIFVSNSHASTWILPPKGVDIFGQTTSIRVSSKDTLLDIARSYDIGQIEILLANPGVDRWLPENDQEVILPSRYIIPDVDRIGLVINLAEMRIYYFPEVKNRDKPKIITHPVGIGRMDWDTPLGISKVVEKKKNPTWIPPKSIQMDRIARGEQPYPDVVPPGPTNPLGKYALRLGITGGSYLIHGTIKPFGVGMRVSAGCIRMYPEDIETLFEKIPVGTPVRIINEPIKLGWQFDSLFIELHPPMDEEQEKFEDYEQQVHLFINRFLASHNDREIKDIHINQKVLKQAILEKSGIPVLISQPDM